MGLVDFVNVDGIRVAYRQAGEGQPLVFLHGFTYSSYSFRHNIPILSQFSRVVCPDLVGHGLSDKPKRFDYSLSNQADLLKSFCEELKLDHIALGGCSMGGALAMKMAMQHPDLVERLILVDSAGVDLDVRVPQTLLSIPVLSYFGALIATHRFRKSTEARMMWDESEASDERDRYLEALNSRSVISAGIRNLRANKAFKLEGIDGIQQETLVVWGEVDPLFSSATARHLAEMIRNSRLIFLPDAGHLPNEEKPADFNQVVLDFLLKRIPSATDK